MVGTQGEFMMVQWHITCWMKAIRLHEPVGVKGLVYEEAPDPSRRELMNLALWIITGLLAAVFLVAGAYKLLIPQEKLAKAAGGDGSWISALASSRPSEQSRSWASSA